MNKSFLIFLTIWIKEVIILELRGIKKEGNKNEIYKKIHSTTSKASLYLGLAFFYGRTSSFVNRR